MADENNIVEPKAGVEPVAAAPEGGAELPDELLKLPFMQGVLSGSPGAVSAILSQFDKSEPAKIVIANREPLMRAGVNFYRSLSGDKGVIFNSLHVSGEDLKAADAAGQLESVAPPLEEVNAAIAKSGGANPVLNAQVPEGAKLGSGTAPAAPIEMAPIPPPAAAVQKSYATKRANNLQLGAPASGPVPGQGRLLSTILKPVV